MKINKKRALLTSCSVILLCITLLVGSTYALFTDSISVKNHLNAGTLDIELERTNLEYRVLNSTGYLETTTRNDKVSFTNTTSNQQNIFGMTDAGDYLIAPGSYFEATMQIVNNGNVAFDYSIGIQLSGATNALAEQLKITVTHPNGETTTKLLSELTGGLSINAGQMAVGDTAQSFKVRIEFLDVEENNSAQTKTAIFDLTVSAVQATK